MRDFEVEHEKRMHLIVVRRDLTGFQHLHPAWTRTAPGARRSRIPEPGSYRVFADFKHEGENQTLAADLAVDGPVDWQALPPDPTPPTTADGYEVGLEGGEPRPASGRARGSRQPRRRARRGRATTSAPGATWSRCARATSPTCTCTRHARRERERIRFATEFPTSGRYRLFLQFKHEGEVHTAAFTRTCASCAWRSRPRRSRSECVCGRAPKPPAGRRRRGRPVAPRGRSVPSSQPRRAAERSRAPLSASTDRVVTRGPRRPAARRGAARARSRPLSEASPRLAGGGRRAWTGRGRSSRRAYGRAVDLPSSNPTSRPAASARLRALARIDGSASSAVTLTPGAARAAATASVPVPHPTSSTSSPPEIAARSSTRRLIALSRTATAATESNSGVSRWKRSAGMKPASSDRTSPFPVYVPCRNAGAMVWDGSAVCFPRAGSARVRRRYRRGGDVPRPGYRGPRAGSRSWPGREPRRRRSVRRHPHGAFPRRPRRAKGDAVLPSATRTRWDSP